MLGFPGEDYTTPQTIQKTGGFGDPATAPERLERLRWALDRTLALGPDRPDAARRLPARAGRPRPQAVPRHAGQGQPARRPRRASPLAFETGQETADLLRRTLDDLKCPNLKVNFDPANMLLYDKGDPIRAVEILGPDIRSVHVKDANRTDASRAPGARKCRSARAQVEHPPVRADAEEGRLPRRPVHRARGRQPGAAHRRHRPRHSVSCRDAWRSDSQRQPTMAYPYSSKLGVSNSRKTPQIVAVEPWANDYTLMPGEELQIMAFGDEAIP